MLTKTKTTFKSPWLGLLLQYLAFDGTKTRTKVEQEHDKDCKKPSPGKSWQWWDYTTYQGCSLLALKYLMERFGYSLVWCNKVFRNLTLTYNGRKRSRNTLRIHLGNLWVAQQCYMRNWLLDFLKSITNIKTKNVWFKSYKRYIAFM